jgi:predicted chitinase
MRATEFIVENADQAAVTALQKKHGWSTGTTVNGDLYFTWQGLTYVFYGERMRINVPNTDRSISVVWGKKPDWQGRGNDEISFAQAVQRKILKFDLSIWQQLDRRQINDSQALQKFKLENERQAREAITQGATESINEQENPKVDLTPNYPNYQVLVGEFVGIKKNRAIFLIVASELKPGVRETDKIFKARTTNTPISIEIGRVKNRNVIDEDLSRRGFLGGLASMAALGTRDTKPTVNKDTPTEPEKEPPIATLSNNPQIESLLHRAAVAAGIVGIELAQFMAQTKHESWNFSRLKEKGIGKGYFAKKYDPKYAPKTAKILGNKQVGDGEKFHGRGFIQLTGRDNYRMASQALGIDLLNDPYLAERPDVAAKIAVWYWKTRVKPYINNFNDTKAVTQKINPALRGLQDRHAKFIDYKNIL